LSTVNRLHQLHRPPADFDHMASYVQGYQLM